MKSTLNLESSCSYRCLQTTKKKIIAKEDVTLPTIRIKEVEIDSGSLAQG